MPPRAIHLSSKWLYVRRSSFDRKVKWSPWSLSTSCESIRV